MTGNENPRHNLRLTPALKAKLAHAAIDNGRSVNAEILIRLEGSFGPDPATLLADVLRPLALLSESELQVVVDHLAGAASIMANAKRESSS